MPPSRRDHLVETALKLFYRHGFHATGIDGILAEAGVAKMTLYNHFKSKDELILAALRRRDETWRHWFQRAVDRRSSTPEERLIAMFDALKEWFDGDFSGCMFVNATAEYANSEDPIHRASAEHKRLVRQYVRSLAADAGAQDPDALAGHLCLLLEGATVSAQVTGEADSAMDAKRAAQVLIGASVTVSSNMVA